MTDLMKIVLELSLSGTVLAGALALTRRLLKNKLPQTLFYYLWVLVLVRLIVPVAVQMPEELRVHQLEAVEAPVQQVQIDPEWSASVQQGVNQLPSGTADSQWELVIRPGTALSQPSVPEPTPEPWHRQAWQFLCDHLTTLWLCGALVHFLWFALSYLRFYRRLEQLCTPLWEHEQVLLDVLRKDMSVTACRSPLAGTPMLVGLLRPRIILPDTEINTLQLEYILRHELTHLRRRDLVYKWFAVAVTSFHWFNPLMPWLRKEISHCCELSCDEAVIGALSEEQKQQYGETLLALAALHALPRAVPATTLCEEKAQLKERLLGIMKYKKATALILLLSCLLTVLIAGCAAVLGPQKPVVESVLGPLAEEQQAPILENIRAWAEQNIETQGTYELKYVHEPESAYGVGSLSVLGWDSYLYDIHTDEIRLIDGTYPDSANLGHIQLIIREGESMRALHTFHLTGGDPAKAASPFLALEQLAADYPQGKVTQLQWYKKHGQYLYIRVDFVSDGTGLCFEYTSINGRFHVREYERALQREQGMSIPVLVKSLQAVVHWQETQSSEHDRENYNLGTWAPSWLSNMINYGDFAEFENMVVYDLATDEIALEEKPYTGSAEHGAFTLLHPAEEPRRWVYIVDDSGDNSLRAGMLAVVTEDTPLEYAHAHTVDDLGREVLMDMAMTVQKGTLVYLDAVEGSNCEVTVLAGEPPRVQGTLNARLLSTDLTQSNQVILQDTDCYDDAGGTVVDTRSGVANILQQTPHWLCVNLPGGDVAFWVRRVDLRWEWPIAVAQRPETMSAADLKAYYMDFAMDWRVDFVPDFDWNSFNDTVSTQDFLMLTWYLYRDSMLEDGSMSADLVEMVMETQFGIESIRHESLFKTWNWDEAGRKYLPVPQGVAGDSLFDVVTFNAAERWENGAPQTVYTLTLWEYGYPFVYGTEQYSDLANYIADKTAHYRDNVQFLLENKGEQLKNGELTPFEAMQQLILEGNTSGFTKGIEIQLEYYMTDTGPRFLYKSEREFDFTPGEVYENTQYGYRLTLPASWGDDYRLIEEGDSVRVDTAWGGTLCSIFVRDAAAFDEERIPVPYRVLGRNDRYVYLMYFASDVQYDPSNQEAYLGMRQDLLYAPFAIRKELAADLAGKTFVYEKEGFGSDFTIRLHDDGSFGYYEGMLSSHLGMGTWSVEEEILTLHEDVFDRKFRFRIKDGVLQFLQEDSDGFTYLKVADGDRFFETALSVPTDSVLYAKTEDWLEQEFHRVYDPYYDIQELVISNWQESGKEATFYYTMTWLNYNRDPDTVPYIQEAKAKSQSSYETLYQDYLALKTGNYFLKIRWEDDTPTLYSDVSVKGEPEWEEVAIEDHLLQ